MKIFMPCRHPETRRLARRVPLVSGSSKKGFTLIELLVVVLIIGILSAVALPQYYVAVEKARYVQLITVADALANAQRVYYYANGTYALDLNDLDISFPAGGEVSPSGTAVEYKNFRIRNLYPHFNVIEGETPTGPRYYVFYDRELKECRTDKGASKQGKVCKALGATYRGNYSDGSNEDFYRWN